MKDLSLHNKIDKLDAKIDKKLDLITTKVIEIDTRLINVESTMATKSHVSSLLTSMDNFAVRLKRLDDKRWSSHVKS